MKQLLLSLFIVLALNSYSQQTYVPDDNFEEYLELWGMGNGIANDNYVTTSNIVGVTDLNISSKNISDLTGIEDFTSLLGLMCSFNQLTSLDLSQNTALKSLWCGHNPLTSLNLTQNIDLNELALMHNQLVSIDLSGNTALTKLHCDHNPLTSLDLSQNTALTHLYCYNDQLTSLDLSQNTDIYLVNCDSNQLTYLNVPQNTSLFILWCMYNQLPYLDVSQSTALTKLYCGYNALTSLNLTQNIALYDLNCKHNQLTSLNVSEFTSLGYLYCYNNQLTCLNIKNGNNSNMVINATNNPNLNCIEVDDVTWATSNFPDIDVQTSFSTGCNNYCSWGVGIEELNNTPKQLLKIVDLMGRETDYKPNTVLIYLYSDGTTERVFKLEE